MNQLPYDAMPGRERSIENAPSAFNTEDFDTKISSTSFPMADISSNAIAIPSVPTPNEAAILATLAKLIDTPDVFSVESLATKKPMEPAMEGTES